jgi:hypothetical protein
MPLRHVTRAARELIRAAALSALITGSAFAQKTGTLLHPTDSTRHARRPFAENATAESAARGDTIFAALVFDPSLAALARSSAWTASVVRSGSAKEARIQANLCDIAAVLCGATGASSLMFAGPFNTGDDFTELADLGGLVGSARVQGSFTSNATSVGSFYAISGTFAQPSFAFRDSAAFAERSVDHASYAVEAGGGYRWASATIQGSVRWEQSYRPQTAQDVCTPASFGPTGTETCLNIVIGAPASVERTVASVSGAWSIGGNGAARLTISRDLRHAVTGLDLPVWLVANAAGGLAGGIRFGYRTDARQLTVALFVSEFKL